MLECRRYLVDLLHPGAEWPAADQHDDVAGLDAIGAVAFDRLDSGALAGEHPRPSQLAVDAIGVDDARVDRGALDHRPFGRQVAAREGDRTGQAPRARLRGAHDYLVGGHTVAGGQQVAQARAPLRALPPIQHHAQPLAGRRQHVFVHQAQLAQMEHDLGHAAGQEDPHRRVIARPVGQHIHQARHAPVDRDPIVDGWARQAGRVGDRRDVEQQVGGAAEGCVDRHRVVDRFAGQDVARGEPAFVQTQDRACGGAPQLQPDRLARGRQRRVRQCQPQRLGNDLRGRGGAQELATAAGRGAGAATQLGRLLQADLAVGEARADRLDRAGVLALDRWEGDSARHQDRRQMRGAGQGHQHRRQALVAGRHADHRMAGGQRADQAAEHLRGVVAVGQAVEHPLGALGAPVARVGAIAGEGHRVQAA